MKMTRPKISLRIIAYNPSTILQIRINPEALLRE